MATLGALSSATTTLTSRTAATAWSPSREQPPDAAHIARAAMRFVERPPTSKPTQLPYVLRQPEPHQTQRFMVSSWMPACQPPVLFCLIWPVIRTMRAPAGASKKTRACEKNGARPAPPMLRAIMPSLTRPPMMAPPGHWMYASAKPLYRYDCHELLIPSEWHARTVKVPARAAGALARTAAIRDAAVATRRIMARTPLLRWRVLRPVGSAWVAPAPSARRRSPACSPVPARPAPARG